MTKSPKPVAAKRAGPPRVAAKKSARKARSPSTGADQPSRSKNILTAGFKALSNAHEEAVARQGRVFESLLGIGRNRGDDAAGKSANPIAAALDPFGFKKFEDVFDQRVARAMQHLGVPTTEAFAALTAEVERLRETVARLEGQARKR